MSKYTHIVKIRSEILKSLYLVNLVDIKIRIRVRNKRLALSKMCSKSSIDLDDEWIDDSDECSYSSIDCNVPYSIHCHDEWDEDRSDWDNDGWDDEDLPGAGVLKPKQPNPNLPSSMMLVDDDEDRF